MTKNPPRKTKRAPLKARKSTGRGRAASARGKKSQTRRAESSQLASGSVVKILAFLTIIPVAAVLGYGAFKSIHGAVSTGLQSGLGEAMEKSGFAVKRIRIEGLDAAREQDILAALHAVRGRSIFEFDCAAARARLTSMDRIADAQVRRLLPGIIQVHITERKPLAIWQHDGALTLVDASGHAVAPATPQDLEKYPHVVGLGANLHAAAFLDVLARFPNIESRVRAAVRVGDRRWNLQLDNGIEVFLPEMGLENALKELLRLEKENKVFAREVESIDMRLKDRLILKVPSGSTEIRPGPSRNT